MMGQIHDEDTLELLVRKHWGTVYAAGYSVLRSRDDAEDVAQEAILRIFTSIDTFRAGSSFARWAYAIAKNLAIARLRARSREVPLDCAPEAVAEDRLELSVDMRDALAKLPDRLREPLILCYVNGYSGKEIAECLDVPHGTVRSWLCQARRLVKRELTDMTKRSLYELVPRDKLERLSAWLSEFPKSEPTIEIIDIDGPVLDVEMLQLGWDLPPLRAGGATVFAWYECTTGKYECAAYSIALGKTELEGKECWESCSSAPAKGKGAPSYHLWYLAVEGTVLRCIGNYNSCEDRLLTASDCIGWTQGIPRRPGRLPILQKVAKDSFTGPAGQVYAPVGTCEVTIGTKMQRCLRVLGVFGDSGTMGEDYINEDGRIIFARQYSTKKLGASIIRYNAVDYYHKHDIVTDAALDKPLPVF